MRTPDPAAAAPSAACNQLSTPGTASGASRTVTRALTPREPLADAADHRLRRRLGHVELLAQDLAGEGEEQPRPLLLHLGRQLAARREEPRRGLLERVPPGLEAVRPLGVGVGRAPRAGPPAKPAARAPSSIASISAGVGAAGCRGRADSGVAAASTRGRDAKLGNTCARAAGGRQKLRAT